ncbi:MAG TPA: SMP-30/gluconolactonase/LRE family protein [Candidatus Binataceae bacterium]|nr:SMP-30/gluconolactonase/LRE family protein [Candidatus Binataceae bacterium]
MKFEMLASGYGLIEAPRVDEQDRLYFSDVPNGGVYRRNPDGRIETVIPKRRGVGGMMFNQGGGIVTTGRSLILFDEQTAKSRDLFAEWDGKPLMGLNDLTTNDQGSVYSGNLNFDPLSNNKPIPGSLFRIDPPGKATKLWDGIEVTNGLGLSPNRKMLYHSDSPTQAVWVYDVTADGGVKDRRVFAKLPEGMPDGLAVDAEGGVWVAAVRVGEVVHFGNDGVVKERIKFPATMVTSLTFGVRDRNDLYVVTADNTEDAARKGTIWKMRASVPGLPVPNARF